MIDFLEKYGGLCYFEGQDSSQLQKYTIDKYKMNFVDEKDNKGWKALGKTDDFDQDILDPHTYDNMPINLDLCALIYDYYFQNPDESIEFVTKEGQLKPDGSWDWNGGGGKPAAKKTKSKPAAATGRAATRSSAPAASGKRAAPASSPTRRTSPRGITQHKRGLPQKSSNKGPAAKKGKK
jgi:hypothetical protein